MTYSETVRGRVFAADFPGAYGGCPAARPYTGEISPSARRAMAVQAEWKGTRAEIGFHFGSIVDCVHCSSGVSGLPIESHNRSCPEIASKGIRTIRFETDAEGTCHSVDLDTWHPGRRSDCADCQS